MVTALLEYLVIMTTLLEYLNVLRIQLNACIL